MSWNNHLRLDLLQCLHGLRNDWLKERPSKMESSNQSINLLNICLRPYLPQNVNHTCMPTAGRHNKAFVADMDDNRLVIIYPRIRLPDPIDLRLLILQSLFKISSPFNLSRDE